MAFEYVIKFVIGANPTRPEVVAPGYYWTAINIYNASACSDASLSWKAAQALPGLMQGVTSPWGNASLTHGHGFEIDNADIDAALVRGGARRRPPEGSAGQYVHGKGFVVIRSNIALDIVAVYTASGKDGSVTLHTERVAGRETKEEACGTLKVSFDTNTAWTLVSQPNSTVPTPATAYAHSAWAAASGSAQWIGIKSASDGVYAYERTFNIGCDAAYVITGNLVARGDNECRFLLNGTEFASIPSSYGIQTIPTVPQPPTSLIRQGVNTLRVEVTNQGGPVGLMVSGALAIQGAACSKEASMDTRKEAVSATVPTERRE